MGTFEEDLNAIQYPHFADVSLHDPATICEMIVKSYLSQLANRGWFHKHLIPGCPCCDPEAQIKEGLS